MNRKDHDLFQFISVDKTHYSNGFYRYEFPNGNINLKDSSIALESISGLLSYYNITTALNNRIFTIGFPEAGSYIFNQLMIPEGFYTIESLNAWIQFWSIDNNYYLIDDLGNYVYYVELIYNSTFGRVQLNLYEVPTVSEFASKTGWTNPGWNLPTVSGRRPIFVVGESNNFGKFIGFKGDSLGYNDESRLGDFAPENETTVVVSCSNLDNKYSYPSNKIYSFNTTEANNSRFIDIKPIDLVFIDFSDGNVSYIDIKLSDLLGNTISVDNIKLNLIIKIRQII